MMADATEPNPDAGRATLVYELCCPVCGDYDNVLPPLRENAEGCGWRRTEAMGWAHIDCAQDDWP